MEGARQLDIKARMDEIADFRAYLEHSLRDPFTFDLKDCTLIEVINICIKSKSKVRPKYKGHVNSLLYNLHMLEEKYHVTLHPVQVTDVFWGYFIAFLQERGLKSSSIATLCAQLRSILNWAVKYNATVSPTYSDILVPKAHNFEIALTADEVSRIYYFDLERFYADRRKDFRETMEKVRSMFVLSCNLYQRFSDMVRIEPSCFDRNIFRIVQQKTGNKAVVNIDKYSVEPKTTYAILAKYNSYAPFTGTIGNYNFYLHQLMRDIGFTETVRVEERVDGELVTKNVPKWKMIASHTARRTAITIAILRGHNIHAIKKCSGHSDLRILEGYVKDGEE